MESEIVVGIQGESRDNSQIGGRKSKIGIGNMKKGSNYYMATRKRVWGLSIKTCE